MGTSFKQLEADFQRKLNEYQTTYKDYMVALNQELGTYWSVQENVTVSNKNKDAMLPFVTMPSISQEQCLHSCSSDKKCKYVLFSDSGNGGCAANQCLKWTKDASGLTKAKSSPKDYDIYVGSSESNPKIVTLPDVGIDVSPTPTNPQDPNWNNIFTVSVTGNQLTVTRVDQNSGWGQILELKGTRPAGEGNLMLNKACVDGSGPVETNYIYKGWEKPGWKDSVNTSFIENPDAINNDEWKFLGTSQNLAACKDDANASDQGPFGSIVFFGMNGEDNKKWANHCYGGVPSTSTQGIEMEGVYSSVPPMGSTNLGGSSVVSYIIKLRQLNDGLTRDIKLMEKQLSAVDFSDSKMTKEIAVTKKNLMTDYEKLQNDRKELDTMNDVLTDLDAKLGILQRVTTREKFLYIGSILAVMVVLGFMIKRYS